MRAVRVLRVCASVWLCAGEGRDTGHARGAGVKKNQYGFPYSRDVIVHAKFKSTALLLKYTMYRVRTLHTYYMHFTYTYSYTMYTYTFTYTYT